MGGIFTPASLLELSDAIVFNDGGLPLPADTLLSSLSTHTITWQLPNKVLGHILPALPVNQGHTVSCEKKKNVVSTKKNSEKNY